jgi:hypothetical protein
MYLVSTIIFSFPFLSLKLFFPKFWDGKFIPVNIYPDSGKTEKLSVSIYLCVYVCLSIYLSFVRPSICTSVCLSIYFSFVHLSVCPSVCLCFFSYFEFLILIESLSFYSFRNLRRERELFLVPKNSCREVLGNPFHENFRNCRDMTGKIMMLSN